MAGILLPSEAFLYDLTCDKIQVDPPFCCIEFLQTIRAASNMPFALNIKYKNRAETLELFCTPKYLLKNKFSMILPYMRKY